MNGNHGRYVAQLVMVAGDTEIEHVTGNLMATLRQIVKDPLKNL